MTLPARPLRMAALVQVLLALLALLAGAGALAQEPMAQEHEVKAAYLLKFPAFVEWPLAEPHEEPFAIALVGAERVAAELRLLTQGRRINGRQVEVQEVLPGEPVPRAEMVFVGRSAAARLGSIAEKLAGEPVLLVGESQSSLEQGAVLNFVLSEGRVRFEVSLTAADARALRISPRLLALATLVRPGRP
ncbi:MAG TPA: YfiR family protein [Myxococcota bacterium]|nr:YfiR family protein [Myxococcota bacterium]